MPSPPASPWIRTERAHPFIWIVFVTNPMVVAVVLAVVWSYFVSVLGFVPTVLVAAVLFGMDIPLDLFVWRTFRVQEIRVTELGIDVTMGSGRTLFVAAADVQLSPRNPAGFGFLRTGPGAGVILSPHQFAAATTRFPGSPASGATPPARLS